MATTRHADLPPTPAGQQSLLETTLRRDRLLIIAALAAITAVAWLYLIRSASAMDAMTMVQPVSVIDGFILTAVMWIIMMIGMMLPSAAPVILLYARVKRGRDGAFDPARHVGAFTLGYLLAWSGFSIAAAALQVMLGHAALLDAMMQTTSQLLGSFLLITAGVYQLTPVKNACLAHCRSPFDVITQRWQPGTSGALRMGIEHGVYCVGCCWLIMTLLFVTGVMNLVWVAIVAGFVLVEKLLPQGVWLGRMLGATLIVLGLAFALQA